MLHRFRPGIGKWRGLQGASSGSEFLLFYSGRERGRGQCGAVIPGRRATAFTRVFRLRAHALWRTPARRSSRSERRGGSTRYGREPGIQFRRRCLRLDSGLMRPSRVEDAHDCA
jgi:hypothetical protein